MSKRASGPTFEEKPLKKQKLSAWIGQHIMDIVASYSDVREAVLIASDCHLMTREISPPVKAGDLHVFDIWMKFTSPEVQNGTFTYDNYECERFIATDPVVLQYACDRSIGVYSGLSYAVAQMGALEHIKFLHRNEVLSADGALAAVSRFGHESIAQFLFYEFPTIDCTEKNFEDASKYGHLEVLKLLVKHCNVPPVNRGFRNALERGHLDVFQFLLESKLAVCDSDTRLTAVVRGHLGIVKYLFENVEFSMDTCTPNRFLEYAIHGDNIEVVKYLRKKLGCTITSSMVLLTVDHTHSIQMFEYLDRSWDVDSEEHLPVWEVMRSAVHNWDSKFIEYGLRCFEAVDFDSTFTFFEELVIQAIKGGRELIVFQLIEGIFQHDLLTDDQLQKLDAFRDEAYIINQDTICEWLTGFIEVRTQ